ncbi:hypothetical protein BD410DRAFT_808035 [Rickenella mellea]|uniref:Uncharacterized protein n=1 Tax=Rickenella mellea TaxID=50990 RepID=A0A4Y7PM44_9AGAM|nr:hypothetical protein BD410DRAFT_808035 [Rickenella mellea]
MIQSTWNRFIPLAGAALTTVVTHVAHQKAINEQLPDLLSSNLFTEPGPKDSMAAAIINRRDPNAIINIGSFAADHMISGDDAFLSAVAEVAEVATQGYLVTIGIAPSGPVTGFGYVRLGDQLGLPNAPNAHPVSAFKGNPDVHTAAAASFLMELSKEYKPALHEGLMEIAGKWDDEALRAEVLEKIWPGLEKIPIDNAVPEPAAEQGRVAVVPPTFGWDDVGDISSLADMLPAEANQPQILADNRLDGWRRHRPGSRRLVACLGVDDLVIVDMADALMVTTRARSQEVKRLVKKCRDVGWNNVL